MYIKEKEIYPTYISKHNSTREKQIILLMIPNEEKEGHQVKSEGHVVKFEGQRWHYLAVKNLFALLHEITSKHKKHKDDFYCLNCL